MKSKIVINTNISQAIDDIKSGQYQCLYAPVINSNPQQVFYQKRYEELLKLNSQIQYFPLSSINEVPAADKYYLWDTHYEKELSQVENIEKQNRLFSDFDLTQKSFTPFKKVAEQKLPDSYPDVIAPIDQDVRDEIQYYFHQTQLPSTYFETRNGLLHRDDSTRFSKYLSCGVLEVRYLYNQVRDYENRNGANKSTYWIIFELLWREFFYWHYQVHHNKYFSHTGLKGEDDFSKYEQIDLDVFMDKYSSNPFILSASRELKETGFQTNRTRQIFASFLIHCTDYHWRQGASLFEKYLIDYDVYSNWGNWMYLSGVGVDPRGSRFFKISKQLKNYDPQLSYIRYWCPELSHIDDQEVLKRCHQE